MKFIVLLNVLLACTLAVTCARVRSPYQVLGVSVDATSKGITRAYRRLSRQWHPDKSKAPEATERFQEIANAYETLSDPRRRQQYDMGQAYGPFYGQHDPSSFTYDEDLRRRFHQQHGAQWEAGSGGFKMSFTFGGADLRNVLRDMLDHPWVQDKIGWMKGVAGDPITTTTCNALGTLQMLPAWAHILTHSGTAGSVNDREGWLNLTDFAARWEGSAAPCGEGPASSGKMNASPGERAKKAWRNLGRRARGSALWGGLLLVTMQPQKLMGLSPVSLSVGLLALCWKAPCVVSLLQSVASNGEPAATLVAVVVAVASVTAVLLTPLLLLEQLCALAVRTTALFWAMIAAMVVSVLPAVLLTIFLWQLMLFSMSSYLLFVIFCASMVGFLVQNRWVMWLLVGSALAPWFTTLRFILRVWSDPQARPPARSAAAGSAGAARGPGSRGAAPGQQGPRTAAAAAGKPLMRDPLILLPQTLDPVDVVEWAHSWGQFIGRELMGRFVSAVVNVCQATLVALFALMLAGSLSAVTEHATSSITSEKFFWVVGVKLAPMAIPMVFGIKAFPLLAALLS